MQGTQTDPGTRQFQTPDGNFAENEINQIFQGLSDLLQQLLDFEQSQDGAGSTKFILGEVLDFAEQLGGSAIVGGAIRAVGKGSRKIGDVAKMGRKLHPKAGKSAEAIETLQTKYNISDTNIQKQLENIKKNPENYENGMDVINQYLTRDVKNSEAFNNQYGKENLDDAFVDTQDLLKQWEPITEQFKKVSDPTERAQQIERLIGKPITRPMQADIYRAQLQKPAKIYKLQDGKYGSFLESQEQKYQKYLDPKEKLVDGDGLRVSELEELQQARFGDPKKVQQRIQQINDAQPDAKKTFDRGLQELYKKNPFNPKYFDEVGNAVFDWQDIMDPQQITKMVKLESKFPGVLDPKNVSDEQLQRIIEGEKVQKYPVNKNQAAEIQQWREDTRLQNKLLEQNKKQPKLQPKQQMMQTRKVQNDINALIDKDPIKTQLVEGPVGKQIQKNIQVSKQQLQKAAYNVDDKVMQQVDLAAPPNQKQNAEIVRKLNEVKAGGQKPVPEMVAEPVPQEVVDKKLEMPDVKIKVPEGAQPLQIELPKSTQQLRQEHVEKRLHKKPSQRIGMTSQQAVLAAAKTPGWAKLDPQKKLAMVQYFISGAAK